MANSFEQKMQIENLKAQIHSALSTIYLAHGKDAGLKLSNEILDVVAEVTSRAHGKGKAGALFYARADQISVGDPVDLRNFMYSSGKLTSSPAPLQLPEYHAPDTMVRGLRRWAVMDVIRKRAAQVPRWAYYTVAILALYTFCAIISRGGI